MMVKPSSWSRSGKARESHGLNTRTTPRPCCRTRPCEVSDRRAKPEWLLSPTSECRLHGTSLRNFHPFLFMFAAEFQKFQALFSFPDSVLLWHCQAALPSTCYPFPGPQISRHKLKLLSSFTFCHIRFLLVFTSSNKHLRDDYTGARVNSE